MNWGILFHRAGLGAVVLGLVTLSAGAPVTTVMADRARSDRHVLPLSVDGLHAFDLSQWISTHPQSELAILSHVGTTYSNATTSPSDSFPGLLAQVTGGTPKAPVCFTTTRTVETFGAREFKL